MIDHGAALYFHHAWAGGVADPERFAAQPWDPTDHVLLRPRAAAWAQIDEEMTARLDEDALAEVLAEVPDVWLEPVPGRRDARRRCGRRTSPS